MASIFEELMTGGKKITETKLTESFKVKKTTDSKKISPKKIRVESMKIFEDEEVDVLDKEFAAGFDTAEEEDADASDEVVLVIDPELPADEDVPEDAAENLIGDKIYKCPVCGANYACDCNDVENESVELDEDGVPVECPVCGDDSDQILVGEIAPVDGAGEETTQEPVDSEDAETEETDDAEDIDIDVTEDEEFKEESVRRPARRSRRTESKSRKTKKRINESISRDELLRILDREGFRYYEDSSGDIVLDADAAAEVKNLFKELWGEADDYNGPSSPVWTSQGVGFGDNDYSGYYKIELYESKSCPARKFSRKRVKEDVDVDSDVCPECGEEPCTCEECEDYELVPDVDSAVEDFDDIDIKEDTDEATVEVKADTANFYFDEKKFESLVGKMISENYKFNPKFKVNRVSAMGSNLRVDYTVFESKTKKTRGSLIAEGFSTKARRLTLKFKDRGAFTESFTRRHIMTVECVRIKNNFIPTGLKYDYKTKVNESFYRVYGSVNLSEGKKLLRK